MSYSAGARLSAIPNERVELTLASTSKQEIQPLVQLATDVGAASIAGFAVLPAAGGAPARIKVFDQPLHGAIGRGWTCRAFCALHCCPPVLPLRPP